MLQVLARAAFSTIFLILATGTGFRADAFQAAPTSEELQEKSAQKPWEKPLLRCWSNDTETLFDVPAMSNAAGLLFFAGEDGAVFAIDSATGKQAWEATLGGRIAALKLSDKGRVIVISIQESTQETAMPAASNAVPSPTPPLANAAPATPVAAEKKTVVVNALSEESGITVWRKEIDLTGEIQLLANTTGIFILSENGDALALNPVNGELLWRASLGAKITGEPILTEKSLIVGLADKKIVEIARDSGKIGSNYTAQGELNGPMAVVAHQLIYSDKIGNIYALKLMTGLALWKSRAGAAVSSILPTPNGLLVTSNDNFTYMLAANTGDRKWKRKFAGRVIGQPALIENYAVFTPSAGNEAALLELSAGKAVNAIPVLEEGAFFSGAVTKAGDGFALFTSAGTFYYATLCKNK